MARFENIPESHHAMLKGLPCPVFEKTAWVSGPPLKDRRVAIVTTAGMHRRGEKPFVLGAADYRIIPGDTPAKDLVMSHVSVNYDRSGFQQDLNIVLPIDRLRELADEGFVGSVADYHYSFMGATDPTAMEPTARRLAGMLKQDRVDAVLLVPV